MISIAEDGFYSIYDGNKDFQPVKDGKIEVPCNLTACFSKDSEFLAFITNFGSSVAILTTKPLAQKFKINTTTQISHIEFSDKHLLALTENKMLYYLILENKISLIKQVSTFKNLTKFKISPNSKFIFGIGEDFSLFIFDFYFSTPCQTFLGHTSEIFKII